MNVSYGGIRQTPEEIVSEAREQQADIIGLSILSGSHVPLVREVRAKMREAGLDHVPVVVGGIISLWVSGQYLSVPASVGFIALLGIAVAANYMVARALAPLKIVENTALAIANGETDSRVPAWPRETEVGSLSYAMNTMVSKLQDSLVNAQVQEEQMRRFVGDASHELRTPLTSLRTNKMRSALTLLGVIIGIAAVIAIVTLGHSLQASVQKDLDKVGANNYTVQVKERPEEGEEEEADDPFMGGGFVEDESSMLTPDMLDRAKEVMGDQIAGINIGEYNSYSGAFVAEGDEQEKTANLLVRPTNPDYVSGSSYSIVAGRFLSEVLKPWLS